MSSLAGNYMETNVIFQNEFDQHFGKYKNMPIALYGTGKNAELILQYAKGYDFFALVSADLAGRSIYDKRIIKIEEAVKTAQVLIIAANPTSTSIVFARIKDKIPSNIIVYDMRGRRLNGVEYYRENAYWHKRMEELYRIVDLYDVVSFDLFDTLITRRVLRPKDIFLIIEKRLGKKDIKIPFSKWRIHAERGIEKNDCPVLDQIYKKMQNLYDLELETIEALKQMEIQTELEFISCRYIVKELLLYASIKGKTVYITSDMYLPRENLKRFLDICGISCECELIISCEYNSSKESGQLYQVLKEKAQGKSILHIGDNYKSDIENAREKGICAYWLMNGYDLVASSSLAYILNPISIGDRILLGTFIADLFHDPFVLNKNSGKMQITSFQALAYVFLPITILYLNFIIEKSRYYDCLLFASRDGYFLNELFQVAKEKYDLRECAENIYFYASRQAVNRAGVCNVDDIITVCGKLIEDPNLNIKGFLKMQFLIEVDDNLDITSGQAKNQWGEKGLWERVIVYKDEIIKKAEIERQKYLSYINKAGIDQYDRIAIVDIVTQGTLVYGLSKIMNRPMDLISLGTSRIPNRYIEDPRRVNSIYGNVNHRVNGEGYSFSDFSELHLFLEMIYAPNEGQFVGFGKSGEVKTQNNEYDFEMVSSIQKEILCIMKKFPDWREVDVSPRLALDFLRMIDSRYSDMADEIKMRFGFSDPYDASKVDCNLMEII